MKPNFLKTAIFHWLAILSLFSVSAIPPTKASHIGKALQTDKLIFAVIGDFGEAGQPETDVANLVKSWNPSFIVTTGDNNYPNGAVSTIDQNIGQYYHDYIFKYNGKFGSGSAINRFFPALGNHDWDQNNGRQQELYFTLPGNERYYDFIQGPIHFYVLNSNPTEPDGISVESKQAKWLKSSLAVSTSKFDIVVLHHPPYSSGRHGSSKEMQWPYKLWGADAVLAGHDHTYERLTVDGMPYFVNGIGGGQPLYYFAATLSESKVRYNADYGAMRVEANDQFLKFQTYTRTGLLIDEYTMGSAPPIVTSILRRSPNPTNSNRVDFSITFSEAVTGVDISDFILSPANPTDASLLTVSGSGNKYIVSTNSGSSDTVLRLDLTDDDSIINNSGIKLGGAGFGNGNFMNGEAYTVDKTAPVILSIARSTVSPTNAATLDFVITFSEAVSNLDASDFRLISSNNTDGSINSLSGSANLYIATISTGSGDHSLRLEFIDDDGVVDSATNPTGGAGIGNGNFTNAESYVVDKTAPSVISITRANPSPTNASSVEFIVTFSEAVTGLDSSDLALAPVNINGMSKSSIDRVNGSGNTYKVTVNTDLNDEALRLDLINNNSITDMVGNALNSGFDQGESYSMDKSAPAVTSIIRGNADPANSTRVDFIVTFSEAVTGVDASDFSVSTTGISGASIVEVKSFDPFYVVTIDTGLGDGTLKLELLDNDSITNNVPLGGTGSGNGSFFNGDIYTIDKTAPLVTSIIRASPNPNSANSVDFIVTFSESVTGVDGADFSLNSIGLSKVSINGVQGVDPFYIVKTSTGIGSGYLQLSQIENGSITDKASNKLIGAFGSGETYNISKSSVNFPQPTNRDPQKNLLTNKPNPPFTWTSVRNAQGYELVIATDNKFNHIVLSQAVDGTSYTDGLLTDGTFYWHVRAYNSMFQPGRYSTTQSFTIDTTAPKPPLPTEPANNSSTNRRPNFKWISDGSSVSHQIEVDNNPDFSSPEFRAAKSGTTVRSNSLAKDLYYWRVRTKDRAGNWSDWSPSQTFTVR